MQRDLHPLAYQRCSERIFSFLPQAEVIEMKATLLRNVTLPAQCEK